MVEQILVNLEDNPLWNIAAKQDKQRTILREISRSQEEKRFLALYGPAHDTGCTSAEFSEVLKFGRQDSSSPSAVRFSCNATVYNNVSRMQSQDQQ